MRKKYLILLFVFFSSNFLLAEENKIIVKPWVGYTTLSMSKINDNIEKNIVGLSDKYTSKLTNASIFGVDIDFYKFNENISIGPRIFYLSSNKVKSGGMTTLELAPSINNNLIRRKTIYTNEYSVSLLPILFGGKYEKKLGKNISLIGSLYTGIGFATFKRNYCEEKIDTYLISSSIGDVYLNLDSSSNGENIKSRTGFVSDIGFNVEYYFMENFSLGLGVSYRIADIDDMDFSGVSSIWSIGYKF